MVHESPRCHPNTRIKLFERGRVRGKNINMRVSHEMAGMLSVPIRNSLNTISFLFSECVLTARSDNVDFNRIARRKKPNENNNHADTPIFRFTSTLSYQSVGPHKRRKQTKIKRIFEFLSFDECRYARTSKQQRMASSEH